MKRMSDVYYVPLPLNQMDSMHDVYAYSYDGLDQDDLAKSTAHAINHADALADALYECFEEMGLEGKHGERVYKLTEATLRAYRGEK